MKILYLGSMAGTSRDRAKALMRLGHDVRVLDHYSFFPRQYLVRKIIDKYQHITGGKFLSYYYAI